MNGRKRLLLPVGRGREEAARSSWARFDEEALLLLLLLVVVSSPGGGGGDEKPAGQEPPAATTTAATLRRGDRGTASSLCRSRRITGAKGAPCASLAGAGADATLAVITARGTGGMAAGRGVCEWITERTLLLQSVD